MKGTARCLSHDEPISLWSSFPHAFEPHRKQLWRLANTQTYTYMDTQPHSNYEKRWWVRKADWGGETADGSFLQVASPIEYYRPLKIYSGKRKTNCACTRLTCDIESVCICSSCLFLCVSLIFVNAFVHAGTYRRYYKEEMTCIERMVPINIRICCSGLRRRKHSVNCARLARCMH